MRKNIHIGFEYFRKKISKRRTWKLAFYFLVFISILAIAAPLICNEKPLYVKYHGANLFPALSWKGFATVVDPSSGTPEQIVYATTNWRELKKEKVIWCLVPYSPGKSDWLNAGYKSPFAAEVQVDEGLKSDAGLHRHWLGTTKTGADVLSGIIHGTRISLFIGIFSMAIAGSIGIILGALSGFFGDSRVHVSSMGLWAAVIFGLPLSWFYGIHLNPFHYLRSSLVEHLLLILYAVTSFIIIAFVTYLIGKQMGRLLKAGRIIPLPIDQGISRSIEIFNSIPRIVLVVTLSAISHPSILNLVLIIGLTSWTEIARFVRAEMLHVRESEFMQSAEASGIPSARQIIRHALPNVMVPAITAITLGVASAIMLESSLSFLGIGVPADVVTWGSLLNEGRQNFSAWWLITFSGLAIFTTVAAIHLLGDTLNDQTLVDVVEKKEELK